MIELKNISKTFHSTGRTIKAVSNVSLTVDAGEIFGIIGASGAGKSTLIRCVNLLEKPDDGGRVKIGGAELTALSHGELIARRREIGMIFQGFNLLSSRTVFGNVAFPLELIGQRKAVIKARVGDLLNLVGLSEKASDYPAQLSGGQKQRVAIARALASEPKVLLCDEATSALDPGTTRSILALLKSINRQLNLTILLITHELEVIKAICDKVGVMHAGELVETGAVEHVFSNPQHEITKKFLASSFQSDLPVDYQNRLKPSGAPIVRIQFGGHNGQSSVIGNLQRQFGVDARIINAQIESIGAANFGFLLVELRGADEILPDATAYLREHYHGSEVLGYV